LALNLERLRNSVEIYNTTTPELKKRYAECVAQATTQLQEQLPALSETDLAAVAYYIGGLLSSMRDIRLTRASDIIADTAIGYSLGAAKLVGMLDV
jgi:hypothetical protein